MGGVTACFGNEASYALARKADDIGWRKVVGDKYQIVFFQFMKGKLRTAQEIFYYPLADIINIIFSLLEIFVSHVNEGHFKPGGGLFYRPFRIYLLACDVLYCMCNKHFVLQEHRMRINYLNLIFSLESAEFFLDLGKLLLVF